VESKPVTARPRLDDVIHAPNRLGIVALLAATQWAEFAFVRDEVGVSDSVLSKQIAILETAGYVRVRKGHVGKRPRTWVQLTKQGRNAFAAHVAALQEIVARADRPVAAEVSGAPE
jgi:DNA-binding HxlR family transcriptional regulator